jgi:hypothetical protein
MGGVAYFAHIGGFIAGLVIALILRPFMKVRSGRDTSYPNWPRHPELANGPYRNDYTG